MSLKNLSLAVNGSSRPATYSGSKQQKLRELLQSIPGIGPVLATTLIAEIGDMTRFKDAKALVAYASLDPRVRQSGKTLQRNTRLSTIP